MRKQSTQQISITESSACWLKAEPMVQPSALSPSVPPPTPHFTSCVIPCPRLKEGREYIKGRSIEVWVLTLRHEGALRICPVVPGVINQPWPWPADTAENISRDHRVKERGWAVGMAPTDLSINDPEWCRERAVLYTELWEELVNLGNVAQGRQTRGKETTKIALLWSASLTVSHTCTLAMSECRGVHG